MLDIALEGVARLMCKEFATIKSDVMHQHRSKAENTCESTTVLKAIVC